MTKITKQNKNDLHLKTKLFKDKAYITFNNTLSHICIYLQRLQTMYIYRRSYIYICHKSPNDEVGKYSLVNIKTLVRHVFKTHYKL